MDRSQVTPHVSAHFEHLGLQYYVSARYAAMAKLWPVSGNLYHHAVEMLFKGQLAKTRSLQEIKRLGHNLERAWVQFKNLFPQENLSMQDEIVHDLDRFEDIRYPDKILEEGAIGQISWYPTPDQRQLGGPAVNVPGYTISVTTLDRFIAELFRLCSIDPTARMSYFNDHAVRILTNENPSCAGWFPDQHPRQGA